MKKAPFTNLTAAAVEKSALPTVQLESWLLEWIISQITTSDGAPMGVGRDTTAGIVEQIRRHSNCLNEGN